MRPRELGAALALLAAAVLALGARPAWTEMAGVREAELRARRERSEARAELMRLQRGQARLEGAARAHPAGASGARLLRRRVLRVLDGAGVRGVTLEVQAADPQAPPVVRLSAEGAFAELAELAGRLAMPEGGLALDQVRLVSLADVLRLELQGTGWSAPH